jgi:replicative DNA helicase
MPIETLNELYDESAERAILSAWMLDPHVLDDSPLKGRDFIFKRHQYVFEAVQTLNGNNDPVDSISVGAELERNGYLSEVGGRAWLAEVSCEMPSTASVGHYAELVREYSRLRDLQNLGKQIIRETENRVSPEDILKTLDKNLQASYTAQSGTGWKTIQDCIKGTLEHVDRISSGEIGTGLPTGLTALDRKIGGLKPEDLIVVAGRPSMGKTSAACGFMLAATQGGATAGIVSLEMSNIELTKRLLAIKGQGLSMTGLDHGKIPTDGWQSLSEASADLSAHKVFICDDATVSIDQLRMKARSLKRQHGLDLLVIDYLQLLAVDRRAESRVAAMSEISRSLKVLAKELDIPIIALSQLNRACEGRPDKRPLLSDLRETGAIEQDADLVIFIYRDEVYDEESPDRGTAELLIRKNRNGPIGEVRVAWQAQQTRFVDVGDLSFVQD